MAFYSVPFYFFLMSTVLASKLRYSLTTVGLLTKCVVLIVWKGASSKIDLTESESAGVIVGVGAVVATIVVIFFSPYLYRKLVIGDWQLKWYHIPQGPLLLRRGDVPPRPANTPTIQDYYAGHLTKAELDARRAREAQSEDVEKHPDVIGKKVSSEHSPESSQRVAHTEALAGPKRIRPEGPVYSPVVLWFFVKRAALRGVEKDVVAMQSKKDLLSGDLEAMHATGEHLDNNAEYMYSFLQVMTAATASFTHAANDVSK